MASNYPPGGGGGGGSLVPVDLGTVLGDVGVFVQDQVADDGPLALTLLTNALGTGSGPTVVANPDVTGINSFSADSIQVTGSAGANGGYAYISTPNPGLAIGTSDFSFETFAYFTDGSRQQFIFDTRLQAPSGSQDGLYIGWCILTNGRIAFGSNGAWVGESSTSISLNEWHHIVVDRRNGEARIKVDGQLQSSVIPFTTNMQQSSLTMFGPRELSSAFVSGYFNQMRLVIGSIVYGDTYVVPTAPLSANPLPASPTAGQQVLTPAYLCLCMAGGANPTWSQLYLGA